METRIIKIILRTALCILLYSGVRTYLGLYGSGLFNFWSYVNLPTLFAYFLAFDIPTSSFIFIENIYVHCINQDCGSDQF